MILHINAAVAMVLLLSICRVGFAEGVNEPLEGTLWHTRLEEAEAALRKGDWAEALAKVEQADANWPKVWGCGNAAMAARYQRELLRAAALEGVGKTDDAAKTYWVARGDGPVHEADLRLVELYWTAQQLEALRQILDEMDRRHREYWARLRRGAGEAVKHHPRTVEMRKAIALKDAAAAGRWAEVIVALRQRNHQPSGYGPREWASSWEPIYAARLLAAQAKETVPLILEDLDKLSGAAGAPPNWHDLALGVAGTEDAVKRLRKRAGQLPDEPPSIPGLWAHSAGATFIAISALAGPRGEELLRQLIADPTRPESLDKALHHWEQEPWATHLDQFTFPPIPRQVQLPLTPVAALGESKEAQAPADEKD